MPYSHWAGTARVLLHLPRKVYTIRLKTDRLKLPCSQYSLLTRKDRRGNSKGTGKTDSLSAGKLCTRLAVTQ